MALRGALFRSGRSLIHRQSQNEEAVLNQPHLLPAEKRSPVSVLFRFYFNAKIVIDGFQIG